MKRSSSYKKRKRKTLNTSLSKRRKQEKKQEGGYTDKELFLYTGSEQRYLRDIASLRHLNNLSLNKAEDSTNIFYAQSREYGKVADAVGNSVYRPKLYHDSKLTLNLSDLTKIWYESTPNTNNTVTATWIYSEKPPKGSDSAILPYNHSFYSEHDYPTVVTVALLEKTPTGLYITNDQTIYVSDNSGVLEIQVRDPCQPGVSTKYKNEKIPKFSFSNGKGFTMDADGYMYITNNTDQIFTYYNGKPCNGTIDCDGSSIPSNSSSNYTYTVNSFNNIIDIDFDSSYNIHCLNNNNIQLLAWNGDTYTKPYTERLVDINDATITLNNPSSIHVSYATGYNDCIYIADTSNNIILFIPERTGRYYGIDMTLTSAAPGGVRVRRAYVIAGIRGTAGFDMEQDGRAATSAKLNEPKSIVTDSSGNLYIGDTGNHRIRKVDPSGNITTIAGSFKNWAYTEYAEKNREMQKSGSWECEGTKAFTDHYGVTHYLKPRAGGNNKCSQNFDFSGEVAERPKFNDDSESPSDKIYIESPTALKILEIHDGDGDPIKYLFFLTKDSVCRMHIPIPLDDIDTIRENQPAPNPSIPPTTITKIPLYNIDLEKDLLYYLNQDRSIGDTDEDIQNPIPLKIKRLTLDYDRNIYYTVGNAVLRQVFRTTQYLRDNHQLHGLLASFITDEIVSNGGAYLKTDDPNIIAGEYTMDDKNQNIIYLVVIKQIKY